MRHTRKRKCQTSNLTVQRTTLSYLPCSAWGLPCHLCHHKCGELLPHHFTLTELLRRYIFCCTFRRLLIPRNASSPLCYKARCSLEFGLSSPKDRRASPTAPSSHTRLFAKENSTTMFAEEHRIWFISHFNNSLRRYFIKTTRATILFNFYSSIFVECSNSLIFSQH